MYYKYMEKFHTKPDTLLDLLEFTDYVEVMGKVEKYLDAIRKVN